MRDLPTGTVTFLFTDIEGSTRHWEEHPEAMRAGLSTHDALLQRVIKSHGGHVFKTMGDQVCAAFATAPDALAAAVSAQHSLQKESDVAFLRVRMALHTGAVEPREGDYFGPPLNRIARLLTAAHGGQIVLSQPTYELIRDHLPEEAGLRDLGDHRLKDLARSERVFQLLHPEFPAEFPPLQTLDARPNNLPAQPTPLIGREKEVTAVCDLFRWEEVRLVTLTGPGGTGKTRLGLQVAAELLDEFPDGVFLVDLAPLSDPTLVVPTIAQTLGIRQEGPQPVLETLQEALRHKCLLLLLDNFEQVLPAALQVAELLAAAPRLNVLVTSRAVLHLRGERELPVPPLAVPDLKRLPPLPALSQYAAVALFIQQAISARPEFAVTNENAPAVAEICYRIDGLPLAIELAAARVKLFPPPLLLSRLESRLKLLTGGPRDLPERQQTLRSTIGWSYDLLDEAERKLFRRLSVFVGGCTIAAAEAVCNADGGLAPDLLDGITSLLDKSLLRQVEGIDGEPRFQMLETIREYAGEQLVASGEREAMRYEHAQYYLHRAEEPWRLDVEYDNYRATLAWALERSEAETGLRLGAALHWFWWNQCLNDEGLEILEKLLALPGASGRTALRARALDAAGWLAKARDEVIARDFIEESLAIWRELGDRRGIAWSQLSLGQLANDPAVGQALLEEALATAREIGDRGVAAGCLLNLGGHARHQGDWQRAEECFAESLELYRELGSPTNIAELLACLAELAQQHEYDEMAAGLYKESLATYRIWPIPPKGPLAWCLRDFGRLVARQYAVPSAVRIWGAASRIMETYGGNASEIRAMAERALRDEQAFEIAWQEGRAMSQDEAIAFAVQEAEQLCGSLSGEKQPPSTLLTTGHADH